MTANRFLTAIVTAAALSAPASAQLLQGPPLPGLPSVDLPATRDITRPVLDRLEPRTLADLRLDRLRKLVRASPRDLELDPAGAPIVRGEVVAAGISEASLARARQAGFTVLRSDALEGLELSVTVLAPPAGLNPGEALRRLRRIDPEGVYDFNHIYLGASLAEAPAAPAQTRVRSGQAATVGLIDTGLDAGHPALAGVAIEQRGFAPGGVRAAAHGTAVASLLAGQAGGDRSVRLLAADVYGSTPRGGSAEAVTRALAWMAQSDVAVVNVSLVGPRNALMETAIAATQRKGRLVVAAVGNDGPAAPPAYPASYPGVIAVTAVDRRGRVLPEAGKALHVDFAAHGSELRAADVKGGFSNVRGTSFAAPLVAGALAAEGGGKAAVDALAARAQDLGAKGPDRVYGRGMVGQNAPLAAR